MYYRIILIISVFLFSCSKKDSKVTPVTEPLSILDQISGTYHATKLSFDNVDQELSETKNRGVIKIFLSSRGLPNIDISNYWQTIQIADYTTDITLKKIDDRINIYVSEKEIGYVMDNVVYINYADISGTVTNIVAVK